MHRLVGRELWMFFHAVTVSGELWKGRISGLVTDSG